MCGIIGIIGINAGRSVLRQMSDTLMHRGPDDKGDFCIPGLAFGHRRLAIIDLQGGVQPMVDLDTGLVITFNGEIYNYREVRRILELNGFRFQTDSDTEVILKGYIFFKEKVVDHLRGMYAFAIADQIKREVFIARDPFGIKPLYYSQTKGNFSFASEISALMKVPSFNSDLDINAIDQYLQFQYIPAPATAFTCIRKLPPAHYLKVGFDGELRELTKYWSFSFKPVYGRSFSQWLEGLKEIISESVGAHLVSDVPFGAFLSGGIDSSVVVKAMAEKMNQPIKTFSIGFDRQGFDETSYARHVSQR